MWGKSITRRWIIGLGTIGFCGTLVHAGTYHWSSAVSGNWTDAPNWTPIGLPGAVSPIGSPPTPNDDIAILDASGAPYTLTGEARNVHEIQLNSPNLTLNYPADTGLRTDRLVYTASSLALVTVNHNGEIALPAGPVFSGFVGVFSKGSVSVLGNEMPRNMLIEVGSGPETASTPVVLTIQNGPLNIAGVPSSGASISGIDLVQSNNLPAGIDVGGGALYVPGEGLGAIVFTGPTLANPDFINGSLYLRGNAQFHVDTRIEKGVFLQGGDIQISSGKVLSAPTLHWGKPGDGASFSTGAIRGTVTLTQSGSAHVDYGVASFDGTLNGDLRIHSAAALRVTPQSRINGTLTAEAGSFIEATLVDAPQRTRVVGNQFVGSTTLRLLDVAGWSPEPGVYRGVLEMTSGALPTGFVTDIQFNPLWAGLRATSQIDPVNAGMLNLILTGTPGDADLSGFINFDDLLVLAMNYGFANAGWHQGDFNGDQLVNFDDLLALAQRYNHPAVVTDGLTPDFAAEWARAQSMVPEPAAALGVASGLLLLRRRVRRAPA